MIDDIVPDPMETAMGGMQLANRLVMGIGADKLDETSEENRTPCFIMKDCGAVTLDVSVKGPAGAIGRVMGSLGGATNADLVEEEEASPGATSSVRGLSISPGSPLVVSPGGKGSSFLIVPAAAAGPFWRRPW